MRWVSRRASLRSPTQSSSPRRRTGSAPSPTGPYETRGRWAACRGSTCRRSRCDQQTSHVDVVSRCGDIQSSAVDRLQESAFVPEPPPERSRGRSTSEKSEPKAREVWTQTGFGTPMPRPIVRYGAPKVKAVAGEPYFLSSSKKLTSRTLSVLAI